MTRVIAVQVEQMNMLKENYNKSIPAKTVPMNNADLLNGSMNVAVSNPISTPTPTPIDMESQVVNLDSSVNQSGVTNADVTNEVFGPQTSPDISMPAFPSSPLLTDPIQTNTNDSINITNEVPASNVVDVPYQEPVVSSQNVSNVMSDDSYYELLNSLRNMITDFANNAYAAIDKYQEEKLQGKTTGASLITNNESIGVPENKNEVNIINPVSVEPVVSNNSNNIFDSQSTDLDNTVVIPGSVLSNAINEVENGMKFAA